MIPHELPMGKLTDVVKRVDVRECISRGSFALGFIHSYNERNLCNADASLLYEVSLLEPAYSKT